jgi:hypothetical protein
MAFTFNGIGTTFYGHAGARPDGSYVKTEWFVFFYVPIFPIRSLRVVPKGATNLLVYNSQSYLTEPAPLCVRRADPTMMDGQ